jgi:hypothetical protein
MSKLISAIRARALRRLLRDREGGALVEFGLILPALLLVSFGAIEFTITMFDYHRLGEAARRGARQAIISAPVAKLETLQAAGTITCTKKSSLSCGSATMQTSASANFNAILSAVQEIAPGVAAANVTISYSRRERDDLLQLERHRRSQHAGRDQARRDGGARRRDAPIHLVEHRAGARRDRAAVLLDQRGGERLHAFLSLSATVNRRAGRPGSAGVNPVVREDGASPQMAGRAMRWRE